MKLFVEIPSDGDLYLGVIKWKEQTFANQHLERLWEKYRNNNFTFLRKKISHKKILANKL